MNRHMVDLPGGGLKPAHFVLQLATVIRAIFTPFLLNFLVVAHHESN